MKTILVYGFSEFSVEFYKNMAKNEYRLALIEPNEELFIQGRKVFDFAYCAEVNSQEDLNSLGIEQQDVEYMVVASDRATETLFTILSIRSFDQATPIIAIASAIYEDKQMYLAGATVVINPAKISAQRLFRLIHKPKSTKILDEILFGNSNIEFYEYTVEANSSLNGLSLVELDLRRFNLIILGLQDKELSDKFIFSNSGLVHKLDAGDVLVIMGRKEDFIEFTKEVYAV